MQPGWKDADPVAKPNKVIIRHSRPRGNFPLTRLITEGKYQLKAPFPFSSPGGEAAAGDRPAVGEKSKASQASDPVHA